MVAAAKYGGYPDTESRGRALEGFGRSDKGFSELQRGGHFAQGRLGRAKLSGDGRSPHDGDGERIMRGKKKALACSGDRRGDG